jgi:hypothetical protein
VIWVGPRAKYRQMIDDLGEGGVVGKRAIVEVDGHQFMALAQQIMHRDRGIDPPTHQHHAACHIERKSRPPLFRWTPARSAATPFEKRVLGRTPRT